jgi:hypothetical protein
VLRCPVVGGERVPYLLGPEQPRPLGRVFRLPGPAEPGFSTWIRRRACFARAPQKLRSSVSSSRALVDVASRRRVRPGPLALSLAARGQGRRMPWPGSPRNRFQAIPPRGNAISHNDAPSEAQGALPMTAASKTSRTASQWTRPRMRTLCALLGPHRWSLPDAARAVGISRAVLWAWVVAGRRPNPSPRYRQIAEAFAAGRCCQACGAAVMPARSGRGLTRLGRGKGAS